MFVRLIVAVLLFVSLPIISHAQQLSKKKCDPASDCACACSNVINMIKNARLTTRQNMNHLRNIW